jgi:cyclic pyranopterin phosphate synthase
MEFSHLDERGNARMVDVSPKEEIKRTARAAGFIKLHTAALDRIRDKTIPKGDIFTTAKIAGILAAKKTSDLIPLCHPVILDSVDLTFAVLEDRVTIEAAAVCCGRTGIEMEVLSAVSAAALTIYDMCKAVDKQMEIGGIYLIEKKKEQLV